MTQHGQMVENPQIMFHCRSVRDILDAVGIFGSSFPDKLTDMRQTIVIDDSKNADDLSVFTQYMGRLIYNGLATVEEGLQVF